MGRTTPVHADAHADAHAGPHATAGPTPTPTAPPTPTPTAPPTSTPQPQPVPTGPRPTVSPAQATLAADRARIQSAQNDYNDATKAVSDYNATLGRELGNLPAMTDTQRKQYINAFKDKYTKEHGDVFGNLDGASKKLADTLRSARRT